MVNGFKNFEVMLQLTARNIGRAERLERPLSILLSAGTQCLAVSLANEVAKFMTLGSALETYDILEDELFDDYELQEPSGSTIEYVQSVDLT